MKKYKVVFCDLDGTLINPLTAHTFPQGVWDMQFDLKMLNALKALKPEVIAIVTNQGGIEKGFVNEAFFQAKLEYVKVSVTEYTGVPTLGMYCPTNNKDDKYRKPNTEMLRVVLDAVDLNKDCCCMVGDASGLPGQFSDSDKKTAENFGIDYYDVNEFVSYGNEGNTN